MQFVCDILMNCIFSSFPPVISCCLSLLEFERSQIATQRRWLYQFLFLFLTFLLILLIKLIYSLQISMLMSTPLSTLYTAPFLTPVLLLLQFLVLFEACLEAYLQLQQTHLPNPPKLLLLKMTHNLQIQHRSHKPRRRVLLSLL
jgi:hypothetical protein